MLRVDLIPNPSRAWTLTLLLGLANHQVLCIRIIVIRGISRWDDIGDSKVAIYMCKSLGMEMLKAHDHRRSPDG